MNERTVVVTIAPDGTITADAEGFSGDACVRDLERLLDGLAPATASLTRKPTGGQATRAAVQKLRREP